MFTYSAKAPSATAAAPDHETSHPFVRLGEVVDAEVRALWWRMRRNGVHLPPQKNLIIYDGGADPTRPSPRTQSPQPEAGGPGGAS